MTKRRGPKPQKYGRVPDRETLRRTTPWDAPRYTPEPTQHPPANGGVGGMHRDRALVDIVTLRVQKMLPNLAHDALRDANKAAGERNYAKAHTRARWLSCPVCGNVSKSRTGRDELTGTCTSRPACEERQREQENTCDDCGGRGDRHDLTVDH